MKSPTITGCIIGNWGCPCLPVASKKMTCIKIALKRLQKMRGLNHG